MVFVFTEFPQIVAGTTTKNEGNFSLQASCFSKYETKQTQTNRDTLYRSFGFEKLSIPSLIHTDNILILPEDSLNTPADALITTEKNHMIGVTTADCIPVFIYVPNKNIISIIHSGRSGVKLQITEKTILKIKNKYHVHPSDMYIHIGAHICKHCYNVSPAILEEFQQDSPNNCLNMLNIVETRIRELGVKYISIEPLCTLCNTDILYSHRHNDKERMLSFIGIRHMIN